MIDDAPLTKTSQDPLAHISALAGFARTANFPDNAGRLVELAKTVLPLVDRFLAGDKSEDVLTGLKACFPAIQEAVRALSEEIRRVKSPRIAMRGPGSDLRKVVHAGGHIQAVVWGLFPELPDAIANIPETGPSWVELLDGNLKGSRCVLENSGKIMQAWESIGDDATHTTNASMGARPARRSEDL